MSRFLASAFYENDFDIDLARQERYPIWNDRPIVHRSEEEECDVWNNVFTERGCEQYKPRRYILKAFPQLEQSLLSGQSIRIVDLGCGAGATLLPILSMIDSTKDVNPERRIEILGCDLSKIALQSLATRCAQVLETDCLLEESIKIRLVEWDLTKKFEESAIVLKSLSNIRSSFSTKLSSASNINDSDVGKDDQKFEGNFDFDEEISTTKQIDCSRSIVNQIKSNPIFEKNEEEKMTQASADFGLMVFTLSAIDPAEQVQALQHASMQMKVGGLLMIRDYGSWDLIQVRTKKRVGEWTVEKEDGVLCTFYTIESLSELVKRAGMELVEPPRYCTVKNTNRKEDKVMLRVFIRCVARRSEDDVT